MAQRACESQRASRLFVQGKSMATVGNVEQDAEPGPPRVDRTYIYRPDRFRRLRRATILFVHSWALVVWGQYARRGDGLAYSPGPVTSAHALWNADCTWCHEPKTEGGFDPGVSDSACLENASMRRSIISAKVRFHGAQPHRSAGDIRPFATGCGGHRSRRHAEAGVAKPRTISADCKWSASSTVGTT